MWPPLQRRFGDCTSPVSKVDASSDGMKLYRWFECLHRDWRFGDFFEGAYESGQISIIPKPELRSFVLCPLSFCVARPQQQQERTKCLGQLKRTSGWASESELSSKPQGATSILWLQLHGRTWQINHGKKELTQGSFWPYVSWPSW